MRPLYTLSYLLLLSQISFGQWVNIYDNQKVSYLTGHAQQQSIISDSEGGCFVIWQDARNQINIDQIYAQHFDSLGNPSWAIDGIPLSPSNQLQSHMVAITDGQGGAFVVWRDLRDTSNTPSSTGPDIWGQKIDKTGKLWGNGKGLVVEPGEQGAPLIVTDDAGGFIFSFEDGGNFPASRSEGYWMQRVSTNGNAMWSSGGELVHKQTSTFSASIDLALASDGQNGAVLMYNEAAFDPSTGTNIYGHRMNQSGIRQWVPVADTIAGIIIERGYPVCVEPGSQTHPILHADEFGNVVVSWQDKRNASWQYGALFAQRIKPDGSLLWNATGVQVSPSGMGALNRFGMAPDLHGGVYFEYATSGHADHDLMRHKLDGTPNWANPINISNNMAYNSPLEATSKGGVALAWLATGINQPGSEDGIMAQVFDSTGAVLQNGGLLMSSYPEDKGPVAIELNTNNELFAVWIDYRRTNGQSGSNADADLFVQGLSSNSINIKEETAVNTFGFELISGSDRIDIEFHNPLNTNTEIKLIDLHGRALEHEFGIKGTSEVTIPMHRVKTGIYVISIESKSGYYSQKIFHQ